MKKLLFILIIITTTIGALSAAEHDPIADAVAHAQVDSMAHTPTGWGAMAFGASALLSPLLGGGAVILAANLIEPDVDVPPARLAQAQATYESGNEIMLYQAQYQRSMAPPIQRARSRRAWIGAGIGFGLNLLIIMAIVSSY